jgi:hypothetical protein
MGYVPYVGFATHRRVTVIIYLCFFFLKMGCHIIRIMPLYYLLGRLSLRDIFYFEITFVSQ